MRDGLVPFGQCRPPSEYVSDEQSRVGGGLPIFLSRFLARSTVVSFKRETGERRSALSGDRLVAGVKGKKIGENGGRRRRAEATY